MEIKKSTLVRSALLVVPALLLSLSMQAQPEGVKVIEIRNYLLRTGTREKYINAFETLLMDTLNARKNYVLGQYRVKSEDDHFSWMRGFDDMRSRKSALESFFRSKHWAKVQSEPGKYLVNYSNVYLLKPLFISGKGMDSSSAFDANWFGKPKGVTVVDFYIANEMRAQLLDFVQTNYDSIVHAVGLKDITYWISEMAPNNYPNLPVFQDKNLLVTISFYKDEPEYEAMSKRIEASMNEEQKLKWKQLVTTKTTWTLYPTERTFTSTSK